MARSTSSSGSQLGEQHDVVDAALEAVRVGGIDRGADGVRDLGR